MSLSGDTALFIPMAKIWTCEGYGYGESEPTVQGVFSSEERASEYAYKWNIESVNTLKEFRLKVVERELDPEYPT